MIRRLFTAASVLSLVLFVATVSLWVRTYWIEDALQRSGSSGFYEFNAARGRLEASWSTEPYSAYWDGFGWQHASIKPPGDLELPPPEPPLFASSPRPLYRRYVDCMGFGLLTHEYAASDSLQHDLIVPLWFPAAVFAAPLLYLAARRRGRRAQRAVSCVACGYDLRASTDRCPECGTPIGHSAA